MIERIEKSGIVPVVVLDREEDAVPLAEALLAGGLDVMEITFRTAAAEGLAFSPGVMTPGEVEQALSLGCKLLKFFPAEAAGGTAMLKSLAGPYAHTGVRFIPTGGIGPKNLGDYLKLPIVAAIGGSWMVEKALVAEGRWSEITALTKAALAAAGAAR